MRWWSVLGYYDQLCSVHMRNAIRKYRSVTTKMPHLTITLRQAIEHVKANLDLYMRKHVEPCTNDLRLYIDTANQATVLRLYFRGVLVREDRTHSGAIDNHANINEIHGAWLILKKNWTHVKYITEAARQTPVLYMDNLVTIQALQGKVKDPELGFYAQKIRTLLEDWKFLHVPGKQNPADRGTRLGKIRNQVD